jgi:GT2 family glycosyltransferase
MTEIRLSAIILNYKDPELTRRCVNYLIDASEEADINTQVIVVDNSAPETAETLKKILPDGVEIIENTVNQGFSRANNQGIEVASGDYILLLNNDAFVNPETLINGVKYHEEHVNCGLWSPKLVGEDGSFQVSCAYLPSIRGLISEYLRFKNSDWYRDPEKWTGPVDVGNVVGAFMLMKHALIDDVGLLDEDYFFTVEDVDYCKRVHEAGFTVIYDPRFSVVHIGGASQPGKWVNDPYIHKNRALYFKKNHGILMGFLAGLIIWWGLSMRKFMMWRAGEG